MKNNRRHRIYNLLLITKWHLSPTFYCGDKEEFICHAIERAASRMGDGEAGEWAKKIIMKRIHPEETAENWLRETVGDEAVQAEHKDAIQKWRHRWLDSLIKEFSK